MELSRTFINIDSNFPKVFSRNLNGEVRSVVHCTAVFRTNYPCQSPKMRTTSRTRWLCCIPIEGAVTALGYFQASVAAIGILVILRTMALALYGYIESVPHQDGSPSDEVVQKVVSGLLLFVIRMSALRLLAVILILISAVILLVGVKKRRPGFVLAYFIISLPAALALAGLLLYYVFEESKIIYVERFIEVSLALLVYLVFLVMVFVVYRDIAAEKSNKMIYNSLPENNHYGYEVMEKAEKDVV